LFWPFIDNEFSENIDYVEIRVSLPGNSENLKVWAHGSINGNVNISSKSSVTAIINDYNAYTLTDVRVTFDKSLVPYANKVSKVDALDNILEIEKVKADEANRLRERARLIMDTIKVVSIF
jgi:hypothetical protein